MRIETDINPIVQDETTIRTHLLGRGLEGLSSQSEKSDVLKSALAELDAIGNETTANATKKLAKQLDDFEPSITMIGQVKAGKTSLVNAMVGWPDLLPADVNPWTSVVTSLHLNPDIHDATNSATFKFFDDTEWGRLLERGGRIGELASRAGADDELENVREQIEQMRQKSQARLGKRFELLLGQEHDYGYFDKDLIERYVCLGDDFEEDETLAENQGRFADITKSADLHLHRPELKSKLCIRDTPGVNDTFMMREQITIRAIRGSRLCVVVLSAHQALSTVDMALIRLISNIKSREVIIFVNRIDELSDPANQIGEIRKSIQNTLTEHDGPTDAQIIFGSAHWANHALTGTLEELDDDSRAALQNWSEHEQEQKDETPPEKLWRLSGVTALFEAISTRIVEGAGQETIDKVARSAVNLANGMHATNQVVELKFGDQTPVAMSAADLTLLFDDIEGRYRTQLNNDLDKLISQFQARIDTSHRSFLDRATASLVNHLDRYGEEHVWKYDPAGLRVLLRSSYKIFGSRIQKSATNIYAGVAAEIMAIYDQALTGMDVDFNIEAPTPPRMPPPVFLGQTIALDIQGSWWKSWWQRRRGYRAYASEFFNMIMQETDPLVRELKIDQAEAIRVASIEILDSFISDQREIILNVAQHADAGKDELQNLLGENSSSDRKRVVQDTISTLNRYVA